MFTYHADLLKNKIQNKPKLHKHDISAIIKKMAEKNRSIS